MYSYVPRSSKFRDKQLEAFNQCLAPHVGDWRFKVPLDMYEYMHNDSASPPLTAAGFALAVGPCRVCVHALYSVQLTCGSKAQGSLQR